MRRAARASVCGTCRRTTLSELTAQVVQALLVRRILLVVLLDAHCDRGLQVGEGSERVGRVVRAARS